MTGELKQEFKDFWTKTAGKVRAYMFCASTVSPVAIDLPDIDIENDSCNTSHSINSTSSTIVLCGCLELKPLMLPVMISMKDVLS